LRAVTRDQLVVSLALEAELTACPPARVQVTISS
jgi:hypothetical protein